MSKTISFIGTGNMGGAIIRSVSQAVNPNQIYITDYNLDKAEELAAGTGCNVVMRNADAVKKGTYIFLCVKPQVMGNVLKEISPLLNESLEKNEEKVLISIAAGLTIENLKAKLNGKCRELPLVRIMPNTPAAIGKGMLALAAGSEVCSNIIDDIMLTLSKAGYIERIPEHLMDSFTVVSGCSPAFVYIFIEALADGAVMTGLDRQRALTYAAQTVMGAASMVIESDLHPGELKDAVCSPNGSTIAGVAALERNAFRSAAIEAILDGYRQNIELGKN